MSNVAFWILGGLPFIILGFTIWAISNPSSPSLSPTTLEDCDRESCEYMRELGWSEKEIEEMMDNCGGHYEPPTPSG